MEDLVNKIVQFFYYEKDETRKAVLKKDLDETHIPRYLGILDKRIKDNGSSEGWIYSQKITYADLRVAVLCDLVVKISGIDALDAFPEVVKLKVTVEALPNFAKWIQELPKPDEF